MFHFYIIKYAAMKNRNIKGFILLVISLFSTCAGSSTATAYGKEFRKYVLTEPNLTPIQRYLKSNLPSWSYLTDEIKDEELPALTSSELGPYTPDLIEYHQERGIAHLEHGEPLTALSHFLNVMHLIRVTEGLYSQNQTSVARNIQSTYYLLKDFKSIARTYQYLFHLNGGERPPFNPSKLEFILEFLEWRRDFIKQDLTAKREDLLELYHLNKRILNAVALDKDLSQEWSVQLSISQLSNLYLIVHVFSSSIRDQETIFREELNTIDSRYGQSKIQQLIKLAEEAASNGRRLLEAEISNPNLTTSNHLYLKLALGDWFQWLKRPSAAKVYYRQAHHLSMTSSEKKLRGLFNAPIELPDNDVFFNRLASEEEKKAFIISANFDVLKTGKVTNLKIEETDLLNSRQARSIIRKIKNTRFRPEFRDGQPVSAVVKNRDYQVFRPINNY